MWNRKLSLYPKGSKTGKNTNLSIFLRPHDVGSGSGSGSDEWRVYAKFKIRVKTHEFGSTHESKGIRLYINFSHLKLKTSFFITKSCWCCYLYVCLSWWSLYIAEADHWFCKTSDGWGFPCFMLLSDLHDSKKGFLWNDTLVVEAQILIVGILKNLV